VWSAGAARGLWSLDLQSGGVQPRAVRGRLPAAAQVGAALSAACAAEDGVRSRGQVRAWVRAVSGEWCVGCVCSRGAYVTAYRTAPCLLRLLLCTRLYAFGPFAALDDAETVGVAPLWTLRVQLVTSESRTQSRVRSGEGRNLQIALS
jgi:hypothetical protein